MIDDIRGIGTMNASTIVSEIGSIEQFDRNMDYCSDGNDGRWICN